MLDDDYGGLLIGGEQSSNSFMRDSQTLNSTNPSIHFSKSSLHKQKSSAEPASPQNDRSISGASSFLGGPLSSKMPQMQGHHEFNPKEASTLLIAEESPSFY